jgi:hypothetical protein
MLNSFRYFYKNISKVIFLCKSTPVAFRVQALGFKSLQKIISENESYPKAISDRNFCNFEEKFRTSLSGLRDQNET